MGDSHPSTATLVGPWRTSRARSSATGRTRPVGSEPGHPLRAEGAVKSARAAVEGGTEDAPEAVRLAQARLAKAATKGRIHKNQAARRTSRLMKSAVSAD